MYKGLFCRGLETGYKHWTTGQKTDSLTWTQTGKFWKEVTYSWRRLRVLFLHPSFLMRRAIICRTRIAETRSDFVMWTAMPHENGHSYVGLYIQRVETFVDVLSKRNDCWSFGAHTIKCIPFHRTLRFREYESYFVFESFGVQTWAARPDIVTVDFCCFSQMVHPISGLVCQIIPLPFSSKRFTIWYFIVGHFTAM
jgi:hypothetical protein